MDKWGKLRAWINDRHDQFEKMYQRTNFNADAAQLGAYRDVYQTMADLDLQEAADKAKAEVRKKP